MKKPVIVLCALFIVHCSFAQQYGWTEISGNLPDFPGDTLIINNPPDTVVAGIHSLFFINDDEGWISTHTFLNDSCMILHTVDRGLSWQVQPIMDYIVAIEMFNELEGYAAAREGTIYHTTNGGESWEYHATTFAWLSDMDFPAGSDTGYACGMSSAIFRITPQGAEQMTTITVSDLVAIHFVNPDNGWACGESIVLTYENGNWIGNQAYPSGFWHDIFFTDTLKGWGAGYWLTGGGTIVDTAVILHTINDSTWFDAQLVNVGNIGSFSKVFFLNDQLGWTINYTGRVYSTSNGGDLWSREAEGMTEEMLTGIQFTSPANGYVIGNKKTLLKYGLLSGAEQREGVEAMRDETVKIFPNPAGDNCKLQIASCKGEECGFIIWDVYGRNVMEFTSGVFPAEGIEIDVSTLRPGIYFVQVRTGSSNGITRLIKQ